MIEYDIGKLQSYIHSKNVNECNFIISGPPGIGKSTLINELIRRGYDALDLEHFEQPDRISIANNLSMFFLGGADLSIKDDKLKKPAIFICMVMNNKDYKEQREVRDDNAIGKGYEHQSERQAERPFWSPNMFNNVVILYKKKSDPIDLQIESLLQLKFDVERLIKNERSERLRIDTKQDLLKYAHFLTAVQSNGAIGRPLIRKVRTAFSTFLDGTPWTILANWTRRKTFFPFNPFDLMKKRIYSMGKFYADEPLFVKLNRKFLSSLAVRRCPVFSRFVVRPRQIETEIPAIVLQDPDVEINGKKNTTGKHFLCYGDPDYELFIATFILNALDYQTEDEDVQKLLQLLTDYRFMTQMPLIVADHPSYRYRLTDRDRTIVDLVVSYYKQYNDDVLTERNLNYWFNNVDELNRKMNFYKGLGADPLLDGRLVNKSEHFIAPSPLFITDNIVINAWYKFTNACFKLVKIAKWKVQWSFIKSFVLKDNVFGDIFLWIKSFIDGLLPGNTVNDRTNNNDQIKRICGFERGPSGELEPKLKTCGLDDIPIIKQDMTDWIQAIKTNNRHYQLPYSTKPREVVWRDSSEGFFELFVSPFVFKQDILKCVEGYLQHLDSEGSDDMKEHASLSAYYENYFKKARFTSVTCKDRFIFAGHWLTNMIMGTIIVLLSYDFEKGILGFLTTNVNAHINKLYLKFGNKFKHVWGMAFDFSHNETNITSNKFIYETFASKFEMFTRLFRRLSFGVIGSPIGPLIHDEFTSSGVFCTTDHNMRSGNMNFSLFLSYLTDPGTETEVVKCFLDHLFSSVYASYFHRLGVLDKEQFYLSKIEELPYFYMSGHKVYYLRPQGTDDQVVNFYSNDITEEEFYKYFDSNKGLQEFMKNLHFNFDKGFGTHFGVKMTSKGYYPDLKATLPKFINWEKQDKGDFKSIPLTSLAEGIDWFQHCYQCGLDAIGGGDFGIYFIARDWILSLLSHSQLDLSEFLNFLNVDYSPVGKEFADALKRAGYDKFMSKKVPSSITKDILTEFCKLVK